MPDAQTLRITIEATGHVECVNGVVARRWIGRTEGGVKVVAWVALLRTDLAGLTPDEAKAAEALLNAALKSVKTELELVSFDMRMV